MIFPEHCKYVGRASTKPCGDRVYALADCLRGTLPKDSNFSRLRSILYATP